VNAASYGDSGGQVPVEGLDHVIVRTAPVPFGVRWFFEWVEVAFICGNRNYGVRAHVVHDPGGQVVEEPAHGLGVGGWYSVRIDIFSPSSVLSAVANVTERPV
jgi:hypothetical protein